MILPGYVEKEDKQPGFKISWLVLFLNIVIYVTLSLAFKEWPSGQLAEKLADRDFRSTVAQMYRQTLDPLEIGEQNPSDEELFTAALRDAQFEKRLKDFPFSGDVVAIAGAQNILKNFYDGYRSSSQYFFGLSSSEVSPWAWLTYQFVHGSLIHLIGNLVIIFLALNYLEKTVSISWLAAVYVISGFVGGLFFLSADKMSGISMVGASACAFGLLGFLLITHHSRIMPWFFVLAPVKGGYGKIYLPVFFILPVLLMTDFLKFLKEPTGMAANVAVSAHVGGALTGMLLGALYLFFRSKASSHGVLGDDDGLDKLP